MNSQGDSHNILSPTTDLVLGFTVSSALAEGKYVSVGSSYEKWARHRVSTSACDGGIELENESLYDPQAIAATDLARNAEKTLIWFRDHLGR